MTDFALADLPVAVIGYGPVGLAAAAGREDEGYRLQDCRGCDKRALPAAEAEDAAPPEQPRRRLHSLVGPAGPSGPAPGPRRPAR